LHHAASAITTGMCDTVLITMADSQVSGMSRDKAIEAMSTAGHPQFERPYGPTIPAFYIARARAMNTPTAPPPPSVRPSPSHAASTRR